MTYFELIRELQDVDLARLQDTVTVYVKGVDEFYAVDQFRIADSDNDVLNEGHPYLEI
jgi:hypothetical protein